MNKGTLKKIRIPVVLMGAGLGASLLACGLETKLLDRDFPFKEPAIVKLERKLEDSNFNLQHALRYNPCNLEEYKRAQHIAQQRYNNEITNNPLSTKDADNYHKRNTLYFSGTVGLAFGGLLLALISGLYADYKRYI